MMVTAAPIAAVAAGGLAGLAAWRAGPIAVVAGLACAAAAALRLPETGLAQVALAVAAGLCGVAAVLDRHQIAAPAPHRNLQKGLAIAAACLALASAAVPAGVPGVIPTPPVAGPAGLVAVTAAALAWLLAATASAAAAALAIAGRARHALAWLVALAPPGLAPLHAAAIIALDHPAAGARVAHPVHAPTAVDAWPFAVWAWAVPLLLGAAVAWAWALHVRGSDWAAATRIRLAGLGVAAVGILTLAAAAWAAASAATGLALPSGTLPDAVPMTGSLSLDVGACAAVLARVPLLALLLAPAAARPVTAAQDWTRGLLLAIGLSLAGLWLATGGGWHGVSWSADPAARALLACILATAATLAAPWRGPSPLRDGALVVAVAAALSLAGGNSAGWHVAGRLLP